MAANVVDLPEPVGPVINAKPWSRSARFATDWGSFSYCKDLLGNDPKNCAGTIALYEVIRAKSADPWQGVGIIEVSFGNEGIPLLHRGDFLQHLPQLLVGDNGPGVDQLERAIPSHSWLEPRRQVQIGAAVVLDIV